ncbi:MAG: ferritin-like domain-containing protein [Desulfobulbaceae bacterium]|uniref:Ferritin-like domain-containing protein n=1 Tax=Candidatus Desulfobia pelagia TaxID=2841692 RepID=A0A8J6NCL1_9BACT|nr:ferritin-like domain-containing protein [Candidatus Desulfobia pelagia]
MQLDIFTDLTVDQFHNYQSEHHEKDYVLVDVRLPEEYEDEHIAGAILMPLGDLTERLNELPDDRDIIFYCNSGRRSRVASLFVTSVPFSQKKIYNVLGGILGYFNRTLPDYPALEAVDLDGSMEKLLLSAMNLERGTSIFYKAVLEKTGNTPFRETIEKIARAEDAHARLLYNYWKDTQKKAPSFEEVYESLIGDVIEGGKRLDEQLVLLEDYQKSSPQALLEMILDVEYAAYDLYSAIAEKLRGNTMEEAFLSLAQAEKHHMQLAAKAMR